MERALTAAHGSEYVYVCKYYITRYDIIFVWYVGKEILNLVIFCKGKYINSEQIRWQCERSKRPVGCEEENVRIKFEVLSVGYISGPPKK